MKTSTIRADHQSVSLSRIPLLRHIPAIATTAVLTLASCQQYTPAPTDLEQHSKSWNTRSASDQSVRQFAKKLAQQGKGPSSFNPSNGISLSEAKVITLVYNPDLQQARQQGKVATANAAHAGLWQDPEFGLELRRITDGLPKPWVIDGSLSFTIPLTGRIQSEKQAAELQRQIELTHVQERELEVIHQLSSLWVQWSSLLAELEETQRMTKVIADIIETTDRLVELGELSKNEASLLHIDLVTHQVESSKLKGDVATAKQQIRNTLGLAPKAPLKLIPAIASSSKSLNSDLIKRHNPTLYRLTLEHQLAETNLKREIQKQFPDLKIGPTFESDQGQSSIGIINGIPLPILNSNKKGIATAKAQRELAEKTLETTYERKKGQIEVQKKKLQTLQKIQRETQQKLIPIIDTQLAETRKLTKLGESNLLVLLESLTRSHDTKIRMIELAKQQSLTTLKAKLILGTK